MEQQPMEQEEKEAPSLQERPEQEVPETPAPPEESPAQRLAAAIWRTTADSHVTPLKRLKLSPPEGVTAEEAAALLLAVGTPEEIGRASCRERV